MKIFSFISLTFALIAATFSAPTTPPTGVTGGTPGRDGTGLTNPEKWRSLLELDDVAAPTWGNVTGTLSSQADLAAALASKADSQNGVVVTGADGSRRGFAPTAGTDAARFTAWHNAYTYALTLSGPVSLDCSSGSYLVNREWDGTLIGGIRALYPIKDKMTIRLNGARFYKVASTVAQNALVVGRYYTIGAGGGTANWVSAGATNNNTNTTFQATATAVNTGTGTVIPAPTALFSVENISGVMGGSNWSLIGPGTIEGTAATAAGIGYSGEIGLNVNASHDWTVDRVTFKNHQGTALQANNANFTNDATGYGAKIATGRINARFEFNNLGLYVGQGNEYNHFANCSFNKNLRAADIYGANTNFTGCSVSMNTNGILIRRSAGANDQHGSWIGGSITHNTGYGIQLQAGALDILGNVVSTGFIFTGVTIAGDSTTTNKIESLGGGLNLVGCYVQAPITASTTPTGFNTMQGCFIAGTPGAADDYTSTADLSGAERAKWRIVDCFTLAGVWAQNDPLSGSGAGLTGLDAGNITTGTLLGIPVTGSSADFTTLAASGVTTITNAANTSNFNNGALVVTGGVGVGGNVRSGSSIYANGLLEAGSAFSIGWGGRAQMRSASATQIALRNNGNTADADLTAAWGNFSGNVSGSNLFANSGGFLGWSGGVKLFSPSATLLTLRNNGNTTDADLAAGNVSLSGGLTIVPPASTTPTVNGQLTFEATSNTSVTLRLKGTDGTVRSVVLTLAP